MLRSTRVFIYLLRRLYKMIYLKEQKKGTKSKKNEREEKEGFIVVFHVIKWIYQIKVAADTCKYFTSKSVAYLRTFMYFIKSRKLLGMEEGYSVPACTYIYDIIRVRRN